MKDMHASASETWYKFWNLLYGFLNCILDNFLIQEYMSYHICPLVVIRADR